MTTPSPIRAATSSSLSKSSFDPTDLKYQVDPRYQPDKTSLWKFPEECDGWFHAHNALRGEMQLIQDCIMVIPSHSTQLAQWQVHALQTICQAHFAFVHDHHTNEDKYMAPAFSKRFRYPEKLTDDHDGVKRHLQTLQTSVARLKKGQNSETTMAALMQEWKQYSEDIQQHFREEEEIGIPLMRAYFTPKEIFRIVSQFTIRSPRLQSGSFIYHMGGQERFRSEFMKQEGIPFFAWHIMLSRHLKAYQKEFLSVVQDLKSGVEPVPKTSGVLGCRP